LFGTLLLHWKPVTAVGVAEVVDAFKMIGVPAQIVWSKPPDTIGCGNTFTGPWALV